MKFLLDTNQWSFIQRKHPTVLACLMSLPPTAELYMSVVSQGELLGGVETLPE